MSFSEQVREQIRDALTNADRRFCCLYGILLYAKHFSSEKISMKSESRIFREVFPALFSEAFPDEGALEITENPRKDGETLYRYSILDKALIQKICMKFAIDPEDRCLQKNRLDSETQLGILLGGVFLGSGSINDPAKEYHMEFYAPTVQLLSDLTEMLQMVEVAWHCKERGEAATVYIKESDSICDALTFMGAAKSTLEILEIKINKEVSNNINRVNNCDMANIDKAIQAAEKQIEDIGVIVRHDGMKELTPELRELAELRLENHHLSLQELGGMLKKPIGRSGVNHRFRRLSMIAAQYREEEKHGKQ